MVDTCPLWVSNLIYTIMSLKQVDFSKVLNDGQVYDHMMANYDQLGKEWITHQWRWMNAVYQAFKDHYKYMIIISLIEKTLQFYDQMNIKLSYDQFYAKNFLQIDKFSIAELCQKLHLPKETVRRKVLELEKRHFGALTGQGLVNIQLKNYNKAIKSYEKVKEIHPTMKSPDTMINQIKELIKKQSI